MRARDVECPTCEAPAGSRCYDLGTRTGYLTHTHKARKEAAARAEANQDWRDQQRDARNDAGVD